MRRAHDALRAVNPALARRAASPVMPHRICRHCGAYRGRQLAEIKE